MTNHVIKIFDYAKATPSTALPDGAITGNGERILLTEKFPTISTENGERLTIRKL